MRVFRCQPFDLNDKKLIRGAFKTGEPPHVAAAIDRAMMGFLENIIQLMPTMAVCTHCGELELLIPVMEMKNYFDQFVIDQTAQLVANLSGFGIGLQRAKPSANQKQPATPYVEFLP